MFWRWMTIATVGTATLCGNTAARAQTAAADSCERICMIALVDRYLPVDAAIRQIVPFADDCERHENGGQTINNKTPVPWPVGLGSPEADPSMAILGTLTCKAQIDSQVLSFITCLWPCRLAVVDEEKGLVAPCGS